MIDESIDVERDFLDSQHFLFLLEQSITTRNFNYELSSMFKQDEDNDL